MPQSRQLAAIMFTDIVGYTALMGEDEQKAFEVPRSAPVVVSFDPSSGPGGTVVTLTGTGFTDITGVAFNGVAAASYTVVNATTIKATVATEATTGRISVSNANGTAYSRGLFKVPGTHPGPTTTIMVPSTGTEVMARNLKVKAHSNPAFNHFTLRTLGGSTSLLSIRVLDLMGRIVEVRRNIAVNGTLTIGDRYRPGTYFVEVLQGKEKVLLKLVKQSN